LAKSSIDIIDVVGSVCYVFWFAKIVECCRMCSFVSLLSSLGLDEGGKRAGDVDEANYKKKITSVPNHEHLRGMDPPRIFDMSSEIYVLLNVIDVF